ncbi:hypothetical protein Ddye_028788 [Dipteronia dyeriana]|uniref:RNase H type-1 domain-containing protein n=1 Tax=Dipteronia dyeriana TaxID=168575 RepID=A0AAD9TE11_9ROSI|nr:hypothetical protein Ddye_028788 [Dipteronia dyeriana]
MTRCHGSLTRLVPILCSGYKDVENHLLCRVGLPKAKRGSCFLFLSTEFKWDARCQIIDFMCLYAKILSDAKVIVDLVNSGVAHLADVGIIIDDILHLLNCNDISISFVPKSANMVTYGLAKLALVSGRLVLSGV